MVNVKVWLLCVAALFNITLCFNANSAPEYQLSQITDTLQLEEFWYFDDQHQLSFEQVQRGAATQWRNRTASQALAVSNKGTWFTVELSNDQATNRVVYLVLAKPVGLRQQKLWLVQNALVIHSKFDHFANHQSAASIVLPPHSRLNVYFYLQSEMPLTLTAALIDSDTFVSQHGNSHWYLGLAIGAVLCFAIVQFILFFGNGCQSYLLLSGYFLTRALLLASLLGWNLSYLLPDMPELRGAELPLLIALSSIFLFLFTADLFNLKQLNRELNTTINYLCLFLLAYMPMSLLFSATHNLLIGVIVHACSMLILTIISYYLLQQQIRLAKLVMLFCLLELSFIGLMVVALTWYNINITHYKSLLVSSAFYLNGCLISYLISRRFYFEHQDKILAQQQALTHALHSTQANEALLSAQTASQEELEQHVQERTLELNIALQELEQANHELERKNMLDELSGLYNRRFYDQKILAEFRRSKRNLAPLSLVILDIDFFKQINDRYGHIAGDYCIEQMAARIKHSLKRSADVGCRYGGEEFCLILPDTDSQGALDLAERLRHDMEQQTIRYEAHNIQFTISCGVTTYQQQAELSSEQLFALADKALYQAKQQGRNQVQLLLFDPLTTSQESNDEH